MGHLCRAAYVPVLEKECVNLRFQSFAVLAEAAGRSEHLTSGGGGRATSSLRDASQRQSMQRIGEDSIYRDRNVVLGNPATSQVEDICV
jgi:hypothetical protein